MAGESNYNGEKNSGGEILVSIKIIVNNQDWAMAVFSIARRWQENRLGVNQNA